MAAKRNDEVRHPTYGIGQVMDVFTDPQTGAAMMRVNFPNPPGRLPGSNGLFPTGIYPVDALPVVGMDDKN